MRPHPAYPQGVSRDRAPLLPKLRGHFAEFLDHSSLERLGILYLTTCVGLGYGSRRNSLEAFLGSMGSLCFASTAMRHVSASWCPDLPGHRPTRLHQYNHSLAELPSCVTPSLGYYQAGSRAPLFGPRRDLQVRAVSTPGLAMDAPTRAREYQPVVHRLRLSASP